MIYIDFLPSTLLGICFTAIGMLFLLLRANKPGLARGVSVKIIKLVYPSRLNALL